MRPSSRPGTFAGQPRARERTLTPIPFSPHLLRGSGEPVGQPMVEMWRHYEASGAHVRVGSPSPAQQVGRAGLGRGLIGAVSASVSFGPGVFDGVQEDTRG
ncbi:MAG: hypothetical protein U0Z70_14480 [Thermomicrobiales bacterium]